MESSRRPTDIITWPSQCLKRFSVNKQLEVESLQEHSFIAERLVQDHLQSVEGVHALSIKKPLFLPAAGAR